MTLTKTAPDATLPGTPLRQVELIGMGFDAACWDRFEAEFRASAADLSLPESFRVLAVCDPRQHEALWEIAREGEGLLILVVGRAAMLARFGAAHPAVCTECLRYRLLTTGWMAWQGAACNDAEMAAAVARRAAEALRQQDQAGMPGGVVLWEMGMQGWERHPVAARTNCTACATRQGTVIATQRPAAHISPVSGIVYDVHFEERSGVFVSSALFCPPPRLKGSPPVTTPRSSLGRGLSAEQATDGCLFEALENYSFVHRGTEQLVRARLDEHDEIDCLDPRSILLFSPRQYEQRDAWNADVPPRHQVPEAFDPSRAIEWMKGSDLASGDAVWVPAACCLTSYRFAAGEPQFARADNAGSASGATIVEATVSALYETIERDAVSLWWYNRARRPAVDLRSFEEPALGRIAAKLREAGRGLHLLQVTADTGLPTYVAVSAREYGAETIFGASCDASPKVAAVKAVTELVQFLYAIDRYGRHPEIAVWFQRQMAYPQPFLEPLSCVEAPPEPPPMMAWEAMEHCIDRLKRLSLQPVAVNMSRPDVLCPVVRVLAPGMRHIGNRRAEGRLYEAPVRLNWQADRLAEDELNPICCVA